MPAPDPAALTAALAGSVLGHHYHSELPADLAPWYCYFGDAGHSIAVALTAFYREGAHPDEFLVPVPVRTVLRVGWAVKDGYVVADVPYDKSLGLITDPADDEFDTAEPAPAPTGPSPSPRQVSAKDLWGIRDQTLTWLRDTAPIELSFYLDQGLSFALPEDLRGKDHPTIGRGLARAETTRLRRAQLFYVDPDVVRRAVTRVASMGEQDILTPEMLPAPSGLLISAESLSVTTSGVPVIAVSWGRRGDSVWVTWWSDADDNRRRLVTSGQMPRAIARNDELLRGRLQYDNEQELPFTAESADDPFALPVAYDDAGLTPAMRARSRITRALWEIIASGDVHTDTLQPAQRDRRAMERLGLATTIHCCRSRATP